MGGQVAVNATGNVTLASTARIDASGAAGGGTVAIGTTLARANGGPGTVATLTAANVDVGSGARINASATGRGNGGRVTVLSTNNTQMDGTITATGSGLAGNGGFVEVSGDTLGLTGTVKIGAPHGQPGTLLLDPTDLDIIASIVTTSSSVDGEFNNGTLAFGAPDGNPKPSTVSAGTIGNIGNDRHRHRAGDGHDRCSGADQRGERPDHSGRWQPDDRNRHVDQRRRNSSCCKRAARSTSRRPSAAAR